MTTPPITAMRNSSFFWPMRLMEKGKREAMFELYRFCRAVDDIADSALPRHEQEAALDDWQREIAACCAGARQIPLALAIKQYGLKQVYFDEIIEGMRMDVRGEIQQPDAQTLDQYCYRVAGCVGLLAIAIFGCRSAQSEAFAIALGHALQRTNMLRDVVEDAAIGRIYLPREWLEEAGMQGLQPQQVPKQLAALQPVMRRLSDEAATHYAQAAQLAKGEDIKRLMPALMMRDAYGMLWHKMQADGWQHRARYRLGLVQKLQLGIKAAGYALARH